MINLFWDLVNSAGIGDYIYLMFFIRFLIDKDNPHNTGIVTSNRFSYWSIVIAFVVTPIPQWSYLLIILILPELAWAARTDANEKSKIASHSAPVASL